MIWPSMVSVVEIDPILPHFLREPALRSNVALLDGRAPSVLGKTAACGGCMPRAIQALCSIGALSTSTFSRKAHAIVTGHSGTVGPRGMERIGVRQGRTGSAICLTTLTSFLDAEPKGRIAQRLCYLYVYKHDHILDARLQLIYSCYQQVA